MQKNDPIGLLESESNKKSNSDSTQKSLALTTQPRPAVPVPNRGNCMARLVVLYFMNLPSLQLLKLNTYEEVLIKKTHCTGVDLIKIP